MKKWKYSDAQYEQAPKLYDEARLTIREIAEVVGMNKSSVSECIRPEQRIKRRSKATGRLAKGRLPHVPNRLKDDDIDEMPTIDVDAMILKDRQSLREFIATEMRPDYEV